MVMRYQRIACRHVRIGRSKSSTQDLGGTFAGSRTRETSFGGSGLFRQGRRCRRPRPLWSPRQESNLGHWFRRPTRESTTTRGEASVSTSELNGESKYLAFPEGGGEQGINPSHLLREDNDLRVVALIGCRNGEEEGGPPTPRLSRTRSAFKASSAPAGLLPPHTVAATFSRHDECVERGELATSMLRTKAHRSAELAKW